MKRLLAIVCALLAAHVQLDAETGYYSPEALVRFADWLFECGDYARAQGEYLKAHVLSARPADYIVFRLSKSYLLTGDFVNAEKNLSYFIGEFPESAFAGQAVFDLAYILFKTGRFNDSIIILLNLEISDPMLSGKAVLFEAVNYCILKDWDKAIEILSLEPGEIPDELSEAKRTLDEISIRGKGFKEKSPAGAGILSAMVPGLGKIYADRLEDGIFSFFLTAAFAGLSSWGFYRDGITSVSGWVYASIGAVFYAGNVYGSIMAAIIHNRDYSEAMDREVKIVADFLAQ